MVNILLLQFCWVPQLLLLFHLDCISFLPAVLFYNHAMLLWGSNMKGWLFLILWLYECYRWWESWDALLLLLLLLWNVKVLLRLLLLFNSLYYWYMFLVFFGNSLDDDNVSAFNKLLFMRLMFLEPVALPILEMVILFIWFDCFIFPALL